MVGRIGPAGRQQGAGGRRVGRVPQRRNPPDAVALQADRCLLLRDGVQDPLLTHQPWLPRHRRAAGDRGPDARRRNDTQAAWTVALASTDRGALVLCGGGRGFRRLGRSLCLRRLRRCRHGGRRHLRCCRGLRLCWRRRRGGCHRALPLGCGGCKQRGARRTCRDSRRIRHQSDHGTCRPAAADA